MEYVQVWTGRYVMGAFENKLIPEYELQLKPKIDPKSIEGFE